MNRVFEAKNSANTHPETFDLEKILQLQDLSGTEGNDPARKSGNNFLGTEHRSPGRDELIRGL